MKRSTNGDITNFQLYGSVASIMFVMTATATPLSESIKEKLEQIPTITSPLIIELKKMNELKESRSRYQRADTSDAPFKPSNNPLSK